MNPAIRLRRLTEGDLPFADALRAQAGWNQTLGDWNRFLRMNPDGCFLAEWDGRSAGTATTTVHDGGVAWVGMVLVDVEHRKRGIGRALLERCLEHLRGCGVRCIKLDATPLGKPVYEALGFRMEWTLTRWECASAPRLDLEAAAGARGWLIGDAQGTRELDGAAFGVSRERLLSELAGQTLAALVVPSGPGRIRGYGMSRSGSRAVYLGPIAADSPDVGAGLIDALIARCAQAAIYWDIPDANAVANVRAERHGFRRQRTLTRMYWGENAALGNPSMQYALAGPEVG